MYSLLFGHAVHNDNSPPASIPFLGSVDGKLKFYLEWRNRATGQSNLS